MSDKLPFISAITPTFGRVAHLEEAIACFLAQTYQGPREMIVFNSCVEQHLVFEHPLVKIINAKERPKTMGETRNAAIEHANEDALCVNLDDDNIWLSNHLENVVRNFDPEKHGWTRLDRQMYLEGPSLKGITGGTVDTVSFTKKAWREIGGYQFLNCGEDRNFCGRLSTRFQGILVPLANDEISYLYVWGQGDAVYHLSGKGDDKPNEPTGMERTYQHVMDRLNAMQEPRGVIQLKPQLRMDYERIARNYVGAVNKATSRRRGNISLVCLGHAGDLLNVLPLAKYIADKHRKPKFFTSRLYGQVLEGVTYVEPVILDLHDKDITKAIEIARQTCEYVLPVQLHGDGWEIDRLCESYNLEAWRLAGMAQHFHDINRFPLELDNRDFNREQLLVAQAGLRGKPALLVNVTGGLSSPWPLGQQMLERLTAIWKNDFDVIDLNKVVAHRIYDILGLLDAGAMLVTSDTYTLHLATASGIPVIALLNDGEQPFGRPWLKSIPRCNCVLQLGYSNAFAHLEQIDRVIRDYQNCIRKPLVKTVKERWAPRIFHCVEIHGVPDDREARAQKSWHRLYNERGVVPVHYREYRRTARNTIGDPKDLPYIKDLLEDGMKQAADGDILLWTNGDSWLHPELPDVLKLHCGIWEACTSHRVEHDGPIPTDIISPEEFAQKATRHCGRDLFAATKKWLTEHWEEIGDSILGAPTFDLHLAAIVRKSKGYHITRRNSEDVFTCCELPKGYLVHQQHETHWDKQPAHTPSHAHNSMLFENWARKHQPSLTFHNGQI